MSDWKSWIFNPDAILTPSVTCGTCKFYQAKGASYLFVIISFHQDPIEVGFLNKDWMLFFFNHSHNAQESESYFVILCLKNYDLKFCWCNLLAVVSNIAIANYFMQTSFSFFVGRNIAWWPKIEIRGRLCRSDMNLI